MLQKDSKIIAIFCYLSPVVLTAAIMLIDFLDKERRYRWFLFYDWLAVFSISCFIGWFMLPVEIKKSIRLFLKREAWPLLLITIVTLGVRFFLIGSYPFVAVGDQLRDAGLDALNVGSGVLTDLFGFGNYRGYGNFVPLISFYFSLFFKNSALIFQLPSALAGSAAVVLTYLIGTYGWNRRVGAAAALFMLVPSHQLHYSRTELVIISDSPLIMALLAAAILANKTTWGNWWLGLIVGFSLHFYAAIRGSLLIIALATYVGYPLVKALTANREKPIATEKNVLAFLAALVLFGGGLLVGGGPTIRRYFTTPMASVGQAQLLTLHPEFTSLTLLEKSKYLLSQYEKAWLAVVFMPAYDIHFPYRVALLSFPHSWLFVIGTCVLLLNERIRKTPLGVAVIFLLLLHPITNQVAIAEVGIEHRLMSFLPVAMLVAAYGLDSLVQTLHKHRRLGQGVVIFVVVLSFYQLFSYFYYRFSDITLDGNTLNYFLIQNTVNYLRSSGKAKDDVYFLSTDYDLMPPHYGEFFRFYLYPKNIQVINSNAVFVESYRKASPGRSTFVYFQMLAELEKEKDKTVVTVPCGSQSFKVRLNCPLNYRKDLKIYIVNK